MKHDPVRAEQEDAFKAAASSFLEVRAVLSYEHGAQTLTEVNSNPRFSQRLRPG